MIAVLLIVLIGPFFVDWTEYRKTIEDYAEKVLGQPVTVLGDVEVRLLPVPKLVFADVRVGETENPLVTLTSITVVAELPPLIKRELKVQELILDQPILGIGLDEEGQLDWFIGPDSGLDVDIDSVEVDEIRINKGKVNISDARTGQLHTLDDVNILGAVQSIAGPFRAEGTVKYAGRKYRISTATGRWQPDEGVVANTKIATESESARVDLTGNLSLNGGMPTYEGDFNLSSRVPSDITENFIPQIWNGEGKFSLDSSELIVEETNIRFGSEDRAISMQGDMVAVFGLDRNFKVNLAAKQINLDRLMGQGPEEPVATPFAAKKILEFIRNIPVVKGRGTVQANFPSIVVNGSIIQGLELRAESELSGWVVNHLSAQIPGQTRLRSSGNFNLNKPAKYSGSLDLESEHPSSLLSWWQGNPSSENLWLDPLKLTMNMNVGNFGQEFTGIEGQIGEDPLTGFVRVSQNSDYSKQNISVNFEMDALKLAQIQGVSGLLRLPDSRSDTVESSKILSSNIRLKLSAKEIDMGAVTVSSANIALNFNEGKLELTNFEANDFAGASVDASGTIANLLVNPIGSIKMNVDAFDLDNSTSVLEDYFPQNPFVKHLKTQPDLFSPMRFEMKLSVEPYTDESKTLLSFSGTLADTIVNSDFTFVGNPFDYSGNKMDGAFSIESQEGVDLLKQVGINLQDSDELGKASFMGKLGAEDNGDLNVDLSFISAGLEANAVGSVSNFIASSPAYNLKLELKSANLNNLAILTGRNFPSMYGNLPVDFTARISGKGQEFVLSRLKGQYAGVNFSGSLSRSMIRDKQLVRGELDMTELSFQSISELILGQGVWGATGFETNRLDSSSSDVDGIWPNIGFKPAALENGRYEFKINSKKFLFSQDYELPNASFLLFLTPNLLAIDNFNSVVSDGKILGNLNIRQSEGEAVVLGNMEFEDVLLEDIFQKQRVPLSVKGKLNLKSDIETTGRTIAQLVSGVTGVGTFRLEDGEFSKLNAGAFESVVNDADRGMFIDLEIVNDRFSKYLSSDSFRFDLTNGHLSVSAGQIKMDNVELRSEKAEIVLDSVFDIEEWQLESDLTIKSNIVDELAGGSPRADLGFTGPLGSLERTIDTSSFLSFLTIRHYEKVIRERALRDEQAGVSEKAVQELKKLQQEDDTKDRADKSVRSDSAKEGVVNEEEPAQSISDKESIISDTQLQENEKEETHDLRLEDKLPNGLQSKTNEVISDSESNNASSIGSPKLGNIEVLIEQNNNGASLQQNNSENTFENENSREPNDSDKMTGTRQNGLKNPYTKSVDKDIHQEGSQIEIDKFPAQRPASNSDIESRSLAPLEPNPDLSTSVTGKSFAERVKKTLDNSAGQSNEVEGENGNQQ